MKRREGRGESSKPEARTGLLAKARNGGAFFRRCAPDAQLTGFSFSLSQQYMPAWLYPGVRTALTHFYFACPACLSIVVLDLVGLAFPNLPCLPQSDMAVPTAATVTKTRDRLKGSGSDKSEWVTSFAYQLKVLLQRQSRQSRGEVSIRGRTSLGCRPWVSRLIWTR